MNTLELDVVIISTASMDIFSFFEIFSSSLECSSCKCLRNSVSSILLHLKSHEGNAQSKFNKLSISDQYKNSSKTWIQCELGYIFKIIVINNL